jgi:hypothetical protein
VLITEDKDSIKSILEYLDYAIILHNLLLQRKDEIPENWMDRDDLSVIDDPGRAPGGEEQALN